MKKKAFAALAAAVLLCGALTAPAAAEQTYKKGDINMDGTVDVADAMLALKDYTEYMIAGNEHTLTADQQNLADIDGEKDQSVTMGQVRESKVSMVDAIIILQYGTECVANPLLKEMTITEWIEMRKGG